MKERDKMIIMLTTVMVALAYLPATQGKHTVIIVVMFTAVLP